MSKFKIIALMFIVLSLTGCQLANPNYFNSSDKDDFIGIAVNYQRLGDNAEDSKTFVVYVFDNESNLDVAKESHLIAAEIHAEDNKVSTNVEVNIYANASKADHAFSLSTIHEREGEIVYEEATPISIFESSGVGSITYSHERGNKGSKNRKSFSIKVNFESRFADDVLTLHEFDNDHQLKSSTVLESLKDIKPKHEYFIVESVRTDGSLYRQLSTQEISAFREGQDLLTFEFAKFD